MLTAFNRRAKKFRVMIFFVLPLFAAVESSGQKQLPDVTLSLDVDNISLADLLIQITEKSGVSFSYNPKKIPVQQKTRYQATNKKLTQILNELAAEFGLTFELVENQNCPVERWRPVFRAPMFAVK